MFGNKKRMKTAKRVIIVWVITVLRSVCRRRTKAVRDEFKTICIVLCLATVVTRFRFDWVATYAPETNPNDISRRQLMSSAFLPRKSSS